MIRRTFRSLFRLFGGLVAGLTILLLALAWRLSSGPISLAFLSPHVAAILDAPDRRFRVELDDTILTWAGWERTLDVRVVNARAVAGDGTVIASVPELSLSLSARALAQGFLAPRGIELFRPRLHLVRHIDGHLEVGFAHAGTDSASLIASVVAAMEGGAGPDNPLGYLARIVIADAALMVEDRRLGMSWEVPSADIALARDELGIRGEIAFDLRAEDQMTHVAAIANYRSVDRRLDLAFSFGPFNPAVLGGLAPGLQPLAGVDLPVQGTLTVAMAMDGAIEGIGFDLGGGAGRLEVPAPFSQRLSVQRIEVRGRYAGTGDELAVDELFADLGPDGTIVLPAPANHEMPVRTIRARGRYYAGARRLELTKLDADLHGPTASLSATVKGLGGEIAGRATAVVRELPIDGLRRYWPRAWGADAYDWSVVRLSDGTVREARADIDFRSGADGRIELVAIDGAIGFENATVDYLPPMPKVRRVNGSARFNAKRFDISGGGRVAGLVVRRGTVVLSGLDEEDQYADIDLAIDGPLRDAVELIESRPLRFASAVGLTPSKLGGTASVGLKLRFLIERALTLDRVEVGATARLAEVRLADVLDDLDLTQGQFDLEVDKKAMVVGGPANFGTIPARLTWREDFDAAAPVRGRYELKGRVDERQRTAELRLDFPPFTAEVLAGPAEVEAVYTVLRDGRRRLEAKADLKDAGLALPGLAWRKAPGVAANAEIAVAIDRGKIAAVDRFRVSAADLAVDGSAALAADGAPKRVVFRRFAFGRSDLSGEIAPAADGWWEAEVRGAAFDLAPIVEESKVRPEAIAPTEPGPRVRLSAVVDRLWLGAERQVSEVVGVLAYDGERWMRARVQGSLGEGKAFALEIAPQGRAARTLTLRADDAGAAFRAFDLYDNMVGGTLEVEGAYDDSLPSSPLGARLSVKDYRVIKAPLLTRLLSIMALTGIVEALQGEGLSFAVVEAPFTLERGVFEFNDARANGPSLGFTASGRIDTRREVLDLEGTVVPAYVINSLLGHIPLLGQIFTGGERGSGVFAATYKMSGPMADPKISVNPLSALAPGILRRLLGIFGTIETTPAAPAPDPGSPGTR